MRKFTWHEMREYLYKYNEERGYTTKGNKDKIVAVAVITEDSFSKPYTETQRSYAFTNDNKAFLPNQLSNSIFANCLDGTDIGVRLDCYIPSAWKVDYCYLLEENNAEK